MIERLETVGKSGQSAVGVTAMSVIILCRDEGRLIGKYLDSIGENDFPNGWLEVLVVGGMTEDGTRAILHRSADRHAFIKVLDNPKKVRSSCWPSSEGSSICCDVYG